METTIDGVRMIDIAEAARRLGVSRRTVWRWTRRTDGPALPVYGRTVKSAFVRERDLAGLLFRRDSERQWQS